MESSVEVQHSLHVLVSFSRALFLICTRQDICFLVCMVSIDVMKINQIPDTVNETCWIDMVIMHLWLSAHRWFIRIAISHHHSCHPLDASPLSRSECWSTLNICFKLLLINKLIKVVNDSTQCPCPIVHLEVVPPGHHKPMGARLRGVLQARCRDSRGIVTLVWTWGCSKGT